MGKPLFGLEAELAISAISDGRALPTSQVAETLARSVQRTVAYLPGGGSRMFLANGGLFYVDAGYHPEVATPECTSPWEAVCHLRAGERMVARQANLVRNELGADKVLVARTNVDLQTGATWGCHESYLGRLSVAAYKDWLVPHLVSRIVYTGSGGLDPLSPGIRLSISPRVAHIDRVVSPESTANRGIFHTRDEALCNGYSRVHVLAGDNACSQRSTWLKMGTTALVVALGDSEAVDADWIKLPDPLGAMKGFAHDPGYRTSALLKGGVRERMTATQIQRHLLAQVERNIGRGDWPDWAPAVCAAWREALDLVDARAVNDSHAFDWSLKFMLFRREMVRHGFTEPAIATWSDVLEQLWQSTEQGSEQGLEMSSARIRALRDSGALSVEQLDEAARALSVNGLEWRDLDKFNALRRALCATDVRFGELDTGIFEALDRQGLIPDQRIVPEEAIDAASRRAPAGTRAAVRGYWVEKLARRSGRYSCGWQGIYAPRLRLDLGDPFAAAPRWARAPAGHEGHVAGALSHGAVSTHPLVVVVLRAVAAGDIANALAQARMALEVDAAPSLSVCVGLLRALAQLVPNCPRPIVRHDPRALEAVLSRIREHARCLRNANLEEAVATPLFRLYEALGRYDDAQAVIASQVQAADRVSAGVAPSYLLNNYAYEDLLAGRWARAIDGFELARAAYERDSSQDDVANVQANILTCRLATLPHDQWRRLLPELCHVNRVLCGAGDWRARKTLILLARYAEWRGKRAAAIGWARRAVRAAARVATMHRVEDEAYLRSLRSGRARVEAAAVEGRDLS